MSRRFYIPVPTDDGDDTCPHDQGWLVCVVCASAGDALRRLGAGGAVGGARWRPGRALTTAREPRATDKPAEILAVSTTGCFEAIAPFSSEPSRKGSNRPDSSQQGVFCPPIRSSSRDIPALRAGRLEPEAAQTFNNTASLHMVTTIYTVERRRFELPASSVRGI